MGDSYVELMWRVVIDRELKAAFLDLEDAWEYVRLNGGIVIVLSHHEVKPQSGEADDAS